LKAWFRRLRRDDLTNCSSVQAGRAAMQVLDSLQNHAPHAQLVGLAAAFCAMVRRTDVPPAEVFQYGNRILEAREVHTPELGVLRDYLEAEVMGDL
jgi:hypothetical protein